MFTLTVCVLVVVFTALLLTAAIQPQPADYTEAELERRAKHSAVYARMLKRQKLLPDILVLFRVITALLFVLTIILSFSAFGWLIGCILAVAVAIFYPVISRARLFSKVGQVIYQKWEPGLLKMVGRYQPLFYFLRDTALYNKPVTPAVASREELEDIIRSAKDVLTPDQQKLIGSGLAFGDKKVKLAMQPRQEITFIEKGEFLGPLVLDELYETGHSRLPVVDGDLDHVIGVLHLRNLLSLDNKKSVTAERAMEPKVYYVRADDSLERALSMFVKIRHHLMIVVDDTQQTVGLITLEDVVEQLIGRKIADVDDSL